MNVFETNLFLKDKDAVILYLNFESYIPYNAIDLVGEADVDLGTQQIIFE